MEQIIRALELWVELTGIDPNSNSWRMNDWDVHSINSELKEAMTLDETQILPLLMLDYFTTDYLDKRKFSVNEIIANYDTFKDYMDKSKELYSILKSEEINKIRESYEEEFIMALKHYGVENEKVFKMVKDPHSLAFIKRDALKSIEILEIHQFFQGNCDTGRPKYMKKVTEFWNINSLIKMMSNSNDFSGISLNLIRDTLDTSSYFIFAIKNGETISILTDKPKYTHPRQKYMQRRPDRSFADRIFKNHFPYDLLNIEFNESGDRIRVLEDNSVSLVHYQENVHLLKEIKDLNPDEIIWLIMMFQLIEKKFWKENFRTPQLSYTGEMVVNTNLIANGNAIQTLDCYKKIEVPIYKKEDITADKMDTEWEINPTKQNIWIEDRYSDKVDDSLLNLVHGTELNFKLLISSENNDLSLTTVTAQEQKYGVMAIDTTMFGTQDEIIKTHRWIARYNQAKIVKKEAEQEFNQRKNEVLCWYKEKLLENKENLLKAVVYGEFRTPSISYDTFSSEADAKERNILELLHIKNDSYNNSGVALYDEMNHDNYHYKCFITGGNPIMYAKFTPDNSGALSMLCGCELSELPDVLQHWTRDEAYKGNSILYNIDPMEWVVKNPWRDLKLNVIIYFSKSAYNNLRKQEGLSKNILW